MTTTLPRRLVAAGLLGALLILAVAAPVAAHAELESTTPVDGATVEGTPTVIEAVFSEALEDASALSLRDAAGAEIATGGLDPDDAARIVIDEIPELAPGAYEVRWTSATDDGHIERGTWTFTVVAAPTPTPSPSPTASAAPSASAAASAVATDPASPSVAPSATPAPSPDPSDPAAGSSDVLIPIVAGLAIVAVAGGLLLRRRQGP